MNARRPVTLRTRFAGVLAHLAGRVDPSGEPTRQFLVGNTDAGGRWRISLFSPEGVELSGFTGNTLERALVGLALKLQKDRDLHVARASLHEVTSQEIDRALRLPALTDDSRRAQ